MTENIALGGLCKTQRTLMILTKEQAEQLLEASKPLMKFLAENFHPHVIVLVENDNAQIVECSARVQCNDFIQD